MIKSQWRLGGMLGALPALAALVLLTLVGCAGLGGGKSAASGADSSPAAPPERVLPGWMPGGRVMLPNQWSLKPAGWQMTLGQLPLHMALSPDGRHLAVTHSGYGPQEIIIIEIGERRNKIVSRVELPNLWYGLAWSPDGRRLFASGGMDDLIYRFDFAGGYLSGRRELDVSSPDEKRHPAGIALSRDGRRLFAANMLDDSVAVIERVNSVGSATTTTLQYAGAMTFIPLPEESFPYTCLLSPDEQTLFVSLWGAAQVAEVDIAAGAVRRLIPVGDHPNEMLLTGDGERLFVSNANENTVTVIATADGAAVETLNAALYPQAPAGSTPNALAFSPDEEILLIANADNNNLALFEIERDEPSRPLGFIPVGWYPTATLVHPEGAVIYVANGKGQSSKANVMGPQPGRANMTTTEYIGGLFTGTLSRISWPDAAKMAAYTKDAYACSPLRADAGVTAEPDGPNPIPREPGGPTPITHCVYIVKENRTYDQVFGDVEKGNGDPRLCLFPAKVTPNHHALAEEFVLLDNFYVESEVSADGHEWTMGAYATDFVEKHWPALYGHRGRSYNTGYTSEGEFAIAAPSKGYFWDLCARAGVTYRSYGEFIENGETANDPGSARVPALEGHFDPWFRGYDLKYKDVDRAKRFLEELRGFEAVGEMPRFIVLRLPNDHTAGTMENMPTPTAMMADNDLALGMIIEGLSRSRFWGGMAVFVVEDDAQNGPDHVDAHRTVAMVASPWARRGAVDSSFYSTASMLRTMELILGLEPMSQFDAAARPMFASFTMEKDERPYVCRPAEVSLEEKNQRTAWGAEETKTMNLAREDAIDDIRFNEIIWRSVRGADSPMPAPVRAAFIFPHGEEDGDD